MSPLFSKLCGCISGDFERCGISKAVGLRLALLPIFIVATFGVFMALPMTRSTAVLMLQENYPVELLTMFFLFWGSLLGIRLVRKIRPEHNGRLVRLAVAGFSVGLFVVGMEEIAWGQQFFHFRTPALLEAVNAQGELTLHNIEGLQGRSELFHLLFAVGGLIGVSLNAVLPFRTISASPVLVPFFICIFALAGVDLYTDYFPVDFTFDRGMRWMSELVEMLIGLAALLYVWLVSKRFEVAQMIRMET